MIKKQNKKLSRELLSIRKKIDSADRSLFISLSSRFKVVKKLGTIKQKHHLPIIQKNRWNEVVADRLKRAKKLGISEDFTRSLLKLIHKEAVKLQQRKLK